MRRTKYNITRLLRRGRHNDGTYKMTDALVYSYDGNNTAYHFYIKDHLGSNRVVMSENGMVEQKNYYYPFGGVYGDISTGYDVQGFKFNGKELDDKHGLTDYELVGHELKHAYDAQFFKNTNKKDKHGIKYIEFETVNFENLIRQDENMPLRNTYKFEIPQEIKGKKLHYGTK